MVGHVDGAELAMRAVLGQQISLAGAVTLARRLVAEHGGPWTTEYIAMRALRDPDAFMPSDLGVRHALERLGRNGRAGNALRLAETWRPFRAYAVQHLWGSLAPISPGSGSPRVSEPQ
jgi:AraC family transcriptional regulator, regulatory protein of adaptative response / DNA-3-methyladenine glycosylase II